MIERLLKYLDRSTCSFLAVDTIKKELDKEGFIELTYSNFPKLEKKGKYYYKKNDSAIFAFVIPQDIKKNTGYRIIAAHSDSPCFKLKPNPEIIGDGGVVSLNVEKYGGGILYTWFDRPLSLSGRVLIKGKDIYNPETLLFDLKKPVATIPHLAIHFNRAVNEGNPLSVQKDMKPVIGYFTYREIENAMKNGGFIKEMIAENLGIKAEEILDSEIILYPLENARLIGCKKEYIQSGRIDDLSMVFAGLEALLNTREENCEAVRVLAIFDNEETGSATKQGAASPILKNLLHKVNSNLGKDESDFLENIEKSFMISADDAHAWHPNYNEKYDPTNHPVIGGGPVIKINANGKYMTDAVGSAIFQNLCIEANVNYQFFVNHGDVTGGSTLGNIATSQMDIKGVDVGAAIWGMHSANETAGVSDHLDFIKVFSKFWTD